MFSHLVRLSSEGSMADTSPAKLSQVSRAKGKVKKSWISLKSRFEKTFCIKRPTEIIPSPQVQVEIDPYPNEPAEIVPSPRETYDPSQPPVPEDNRTRTRLSSLPGSQKPAEPADVHGHAAPASGRLEATLPRRENGTDESPRSDTTAFGEVEAGTSGCSIKITIEPPSIVVQNSLDAPDLLAVAQEAPAQPRLVQETPAHDNPAQVPQNPGMARSAVPKPMLVFTPASPEDAPAHPPGKPQPFVFTPDQKPALLDPPAAQQYTPVEPANHLQSPSPCVVTPAPGASPLPKKMTPTPPTPLKRQKLLPETVDPLPFRSTRHPPPPDIDTILPAGEKKDFGVIGDRRAAKNQQQTGAVEKPADDPGANKKASPVKEAPMQGGVDGLQQQEGVAKRSVNPFPQPIYAKRRRYYSGKYLGGGTFGKVYSVINTETLSVSALKVIKRKELGRTGLSAVKEELNIMKTLTEIKYLGHRSIPGFRFIVHLEESWFDEDNIYFNMPLCVGTLRDRLQLAKLDPLTMRVYAAELMSGLELLHNLKIIHCDLKPDNILVSPDGHLKISDFGVSVSWIDPRYNNHPPHAFRGRKFVGSYGYMAPDILCADKNSRGPRRGNFGFAADIFSLGIVFAELDMGGSRFVYFEDEEEKKNWEGDFPRFATAMVLSRDSLLKRVQKKLRGDHALLVERMIEITEASRATIDEIFAHPFFSELDMERVLDQGYPVLVPPLESVLPCRHMGVENNWYSRGGCSEGPDKSGASAFVWNLEEELTRHQQWRQLRLAAAKGGSQAKAPG